jgi:hypothetical protein
LNEIAGVNEMENPIDSAQSNAIGSTLVSASISTNNMTSILETRREMYIKGIEKAKASQDATKVRRLDRQLKVGSIMKLSHWIAYTSFLFHS